MLRLSAKLGTLFLMSTLFFSCYSTETGRPAEDSSIDEKQTESVQTSCETVISGGKEEELPNPDGKDAVITLTPADAKALMESGIDYILLDVRTVEEFSEEHLEGALLLPNEQIRNEQPVLLPDLQATVLVYCRSGRRSREAAEKLVSMGYTHIYDIGGIIDWPYGTVSE